MPVRNYNRRLKNYFITAAKCFVKFNPDSHLAGYHRHLRKQGMKPTEALKRVARALVRRIYIDLRDLKIKETESAANETYTHNGNNPSNVASSLNTNYNERYDKEVVVNSENVSEIT